MSDISNKSTIVPQPSLNNPIITNSSKISHTTSESHSVQITTIRLNSDNFLRWSQLVWMYIKGRGKMDYLMGEKRALVVDDLNYAIWDVENSMENVNQMYYDLGNQSQIFELTLKLGEIRQEEDNITKYFNSLKQIWQDLDLFNTYEWKSVEDGRHHKKTMEDYRIFKFLASLNVEFDEVRGRIIGRQPLHSIGEVFSEVRREESRRNVMLGKKGLAVSIEGKTSDKPGRAIIPTANEVETSPFIIEKMKHLLALMKSNSTSSTPSVSVAHTGIGLIKTSERIDLKSILHVPKLDQSLGKTIGSARMINGLYYFEDNLPSNKIAQGLSNTPTLIHASSSPVTDLSLPSHFDPSPEISAPEPGLELAPIIPTQDLDLDLPIALRKGTQACTKHPIAKYISYNNLSDNYRSFTTNISKLVIYQGKKVVGCKWVLTIKSKADGSVQRYKAKLVAKGFTQTYGIYYQETFASVTKINSIRVLLSLAVNSNWPLHQLDVKNVFLNGDLEEEVFMSSPPSFEESFGVRKVCKLKNSLYGLKQLPRVWFEHFGKVIKHYGCTQSQVDHTMFYKHSNEGKVVILIVYVDDIVLTEDDCNELEKLKRKLAEEFEIKDLGTLKYFLGMGFSRSKEGIFVNQRKYVLDLLDETGMLGCKSAETPIEPNVKPQPTKAKNMKDRDRYQRLVGRLIYLSHTCPDIAFSGTPGKGLLFKSRGHLQIEAYTDAYWAGSIVDQRSTSGRLLEELKMTGSSPMKLYCDNEVTISVAHNPVLHDYTKHVEVDKHFIKEKIDNGLVCMTYLLLRNKWLMSSPKDYTRGNSIF
ncbi:Retrovirus-related Pol polyprotein from transposon RE1 [Vitis vinifera]|uniref:Retrovirus-related Pol polyprotein from transposon RE1 n=1 Tax=Vitis vinifera TaxID=29760 RepID=A0A438CVG4_VITVI|nr:Retrovirus-related Pol polyprotein from transposon RE1 [Vitis vinifera]